MEVLPPVLTFSVALWLAVSYPATLIDASASSRRTSNRPSPSRGAADSLLWLLQTFETDVSRQVLELARHDARRRASQKPAGEEGPRHGRAQGCASVPERGRIDGVDTRAKCHDRPTRKSTSGNTPAYSRQSCQVPAGETGRRAHWTRTDHRRYFFESAVTTSRPLAASEPQVTDDVERKIHLNPEQTRLAMSIEQIDKELTENESRSEQVAIAGIRSGGSVPASGGVLRGRDSLDHQHAELLARRAELAAKLKQSVGEHPDTD